MKITLNGGLNEINHLASELDRFATENRIDDLTKNQINLILEELYTNTANYGFKDIADGQVIITLSLVENYLEMVYRDNGIAFNPLEMNAPDLLLDIEERPIGGLGVFFVKAMTDEVNYHREANFNELKMKKIL